jgi:predicted metal-binding protein
LHWTEEALKQIEKAPSFVRGMAKKAVEKEAYKSGREEVTEADVRAAYDKYIKFAVNNDQGKDKEKTIKIAIVRCEIVSEVCPGIACFKAFNCRQLAFEQYGPDAEIIGFFTCGGCSGRRVSRLVEKLIPHGLDVVHLSSCMMLKDDYPPCPHKAQIKRSIENKGVRVVEGTHHL